jgi:hypothetical protein
MIDRELLQGQKLLGWLLILLGLAVLMLIGLAESLERSYSPSMLSAFASWAAQAKGNHTIVGVVAWLLLAGGYIFVLSARVDERLRDISGEFEERVCHLTRELAAFQQRMGDRSGAGDPAGNQAADREPPPGAEPAQRAGEKPVGAAVVMGTASPAANRGASPASRSTGLP